MMVPVGRTMVMTPAAKADILRLTCYVVWPGLLAPVAGGLITTYASWHWIFLINVPLGAVAFAAAWRLVTAEPAGSAAAAPPLDWAGVVLTCAGLGGLTYAAHLVSLPAPPAAQAAVLGAVSLALLTAAVAHLRRAAHPLLNLRTFQTRTFRVSQLGGTMYYFVIGAMPFLLPLMFQVQFGWSPVKSGAVTAFVFAGNVGIKPATTPLINRFGFRPLLIVSTLGTAVIVAALGFTTAATDRGRDGRAARRRRGRQRRPGRLHGRLLRARPGRRELRGRGPAAGPAGGQRRVTGVPPVPLPPSGPPDSPAAPVPRSS
jgi:MFS family permease